MQPWLAVPSGSEFTLQNIPYGAGSYRGTGRRSLFTRLGDSLVDLRQLQEAGAFSSLPERGSCFQQDTLNAFMGLGRTAWRQARQALQQLLGQADSRLAQDSDLQSRCIVDQACASALPGSS